MKSMARIVLCGLAIALTTCFASPVLSQNSQQQDQQQSQQDRNRRPREQERSRQFQQRRQQAQQQQQQQQRRMQASPEGWIRVGVDYDNDGRFDAFETIYVYDLERARQASRQRRDQQRAFRPGREQQFQQRGMRQRRGTRQRQQRQQHTVQGQIRELKTVHLAGVRDSHRIARIETQQGQTAKVDLGPENRLQDLDLQEGTQVTVEGHPGRINDRMMLLADRIESQGQTVQVQRSPDRNLKRVRGEVENIRTAKFRGIDDPHLVAQVRLRSGRQETVNLGPRSELSGLNIQEGDTLAILVRPGRINGQRALIAEQVSMDGETVELPRPQERRRFRPRSQQDRRQQQRGQSQQEDNRA